MSNPPGQMSCSRAARKLGDLLALLPVDNDKTAWRDVEETAQQLANGLRARNAPEDNHTTLGRTLLPQILTSLLKNALNGSPIPSAERTGPVYEILRVAANLCMDHDPNRGHLLEAGFPQATVSLLEGYADTIPSGPQTSPLPLTVPHLKVVKTAVGVLLNASIGFEPVQDRLTALEAAVTLLRLSFAIYPPASWLYAQPCPLTDDQEMNLGKESTADLWSLRSGVLNWSTRTISELQDDSRQIFDQSALPYLVPSLLAFTPPFLPSLPFNASSTLRASLLQADIERLEESCMLLESLALDVEDVRLSLARGFSFPAEHNGMACLSDMLDFIEHGNYHPLWYVRDEVGFDGSDVKGKEKILDRCKAAVIKVIVEVTGEEKNSDVLWDDSAAGGDFASRMVSWIRAYVDSANDGMSREIVRDDLAICATLSLGNLTKRESHATTILSPPISLAPLLSSTAMLGLETDIKLKHGVLGFLKHLSQFSTVSAPIRTALSDAGVVQRIVSSGVWNERTDAMAEVVQISAISVVKHLCNGNLESSLLLVDPEKNDGDVPTGLSQILALVRRSDTVAIKSEGTRVLVHVMKSLWSANGSGSDVSLTEPKEEDNEKERIRKKAIETVMSPACAEALARLIGRSFRYHILINEGVIALTLLCSHPNGASLVAHALIEQLPGEVGSRSNSLPQPAIAPVSSSSVEVSSPTVVSPTARNQIFTPRRALDQLINVLRNSTGDEGAPSMNRVPAEIRANVCLLLSEMGGKTDGEDIDVVKNATKGILEELAQNTESKEKAGILAIAAKRTLDAWAS